MVIEVASNDPLDKIQAAKERDIRFVELQFTDLLGVVKGITIPLYRLEESLEHGTWFDGSSIEGFTRIAESDQWLAPDMNTFAEIPWQGGDPGRPGQPRHRARHLRRHDPERRPFAGDPRWRPAPPARAGAGTGLRRGTPAPSWSSSCSGAAPTATSSRCRTTRLATSTPRRDLAQAIRQRHGRRAGGVRHPRRGLASRGGPRPARDRLPVRRRPEPPTTRSRSSSP